MQLVAFLLLFEARHILWAKRSCIDVIQNKWKLHKGRSLPLNASGWRRTVFSLILLTNLTLPVNSNVTAFAKVGPFSAMWYTCEYCEPTCFYLYTLQTLANSILLCAYSIWRGRSSFLQYHSVWKLRKRLRTAVSLLNKIGVRGSVGSLLCPGGEKFVFDSKLYSEDMSLPTSVAKMVRRAVNFSRSWPRSQAVLVCE